MVKGALSILQPKYFVGCFIAVSTECIILINTFSVRHYLLSASESQGEKNQPTGLKRVVWKAISVEVEHRMCLVWSKDNA